MAGHVKSCLSDRKFPVLCPDPKCGRSLDYSTVQVLVQDSLKDLQVLVKLSTEQAIPLDRRIFCPHKNCSTFIERPPNMDSGYPVECPACQKAFCARCLVVGGHMPVECPAYHKASDASCLVVGGHMSSVI
eukprot:gene1879-33296_t